MKSEYYCLTRFRPAHGTQVGNEFLVGTSLDGMRKFLGILGLFHRAHNNYIGQKTLKDDTCKHRHCKILKWRHLNMIRRYFNETLQSLSEFGVFFGLPNIPPEAFPFFCIRKGFGLHEYNNPDEYLKSRGCWHE